MLNIKQFSVTLVLCKKLFRERKGTGIILGNKIWTVRLQNPNLSVLEIQVVWGTQTRSWIYLVVF